MYYRVKALFSLLICLGFACELSSQHLSHQVLVSAAGVKLNNNYNYAQTIGETAVEIFNGPSNVLTQGFQQPHVTSSPVTQPPGNGVDVYPNPVIDNLTIKFFGDASRDFRIEVLTITGTLILRDEASFIGSYYLEKIIATGSLKSGLYFVRIISTDGLINRTFKIEKL